MEVLPKKFTSIGDVSVVTLIRTDTTLDHSQKAEKVYSGLGELALSAQIETHLAHACQKPHILTVSFATSLVTLHPLYEPISV